MCAVATANVIPLFNGIGMKVEVFGTKLDLKGPHFISLLSLSLSLLSTRSHGLRPLFVLMGAKAALRAIVITACHNVGGCQIGGSQSMVKISRIIRKTDVRVWGWG